MANVSKGTLDKVIDDNAHDGGRSFKLPMILRQYRERVQMRSVSVIIFIIIIIIIIIIMND